MPEADAGAGDGAAPPAEQLFSAGPTMMGAEAREMLLSGDKDAGLVAYKLRMYRKMDADDDNKACRPPPGRSLRKQRFCAPEEL